MKKYKIKVPVKEFIGTEISGIAEIELKFLNEEHAYEYINSKECWDELAEEKNFKYCKHEPIGSIDLDLEQLELEEIVDE